MQKIRWKAAFTLIELLIVVAIIGILAAIAVPNFMNARIRAQVSRMEADHRALLTAMMMYRMDNNTFHAHSHRPQQHVPLTTPMAYLSIWPIDVFQEKLEDSRNPLEKYAKKTIHWEPHGGYTDLTVTASLIQNAPNLVGYNTSLGPSLKSGGGSYNATNGTLSLGMIVKDVPGDPRGDYKFPPGNF